MPSGGGPTQRRLAAILNADAVGYTRLMADDEIATVQTVTEYKREMAELVASHSGRIVDSPGDNVLAEFSSATAAVRCAVQIQDTLAERNGALADHRRMDFRVAVHLGEVVADGERIYGDGVNVVARLEKLAEPGGVCVSQKVVDEVEGKLELGFEDLGEHSVKNFPRPVRAYRVGVGPRVAPAAPGARGAPGRFGVVATGVAVALLAAVWVWQWSKGQAEPQPGRPEIRSLAVLPLENLSRDPDQVYFTDGMTEALIGRLARIASLSVVSKTSVKQYGGVELPLPEIAERLGVDAVVEGSVLRVGDGVRISVQLIDARTDRHLWSAEYQRDLRDVLALQSEVAIAISEEVQMALEPAAQEELEEPQPVDPEAYEEYLKGIHFLMMAGATNHARSVLHLEKAVALDPEFATAWARLSDAYT